MECVAKEDEGRFVLLDDYQPAIVVSVVTAKEENSNEMTVHVVGLINNVEQHIPANNVKLVCRRYKKIGDTEQFLTRIREIESLYEDGVIPDAVREQRTYQVMMDSLVA